GEHTLHVGGVGAGGEGVVVLDHGQATIRADLLRRGRDGGREGVPGVFEVVVDGGVSGHAPQVRRQGAVGVALGHGQAVMVEHDVVHQVDQNLRVLVIGPLTVHPVEVE